MKYDDLGLIEMEATGFPGNIGDSCAETCRIEVLKTKLLTGNPTLAIEEFTTDTGYVRHPKAPEGWREADFSSDQALPLYFAYNMGVPTYAQTMEDRIHADGNKTGNGQLMTPGLYFALNGFPSLLGLCILVQCLIFKLPFRWSDSKKWFELSAGSSSDYLNFVISIFYCDYHQHQWVGNLAFKIVSKEKCLSEIESYYKNEPNAFVVDYYKRALNV